MKNKKVKKIIIAVVVAAVVAVAGVFTANHFLGGNAREEYDFPLETRTLSEYAEGMEKVLKENFKTGDALECTGISMMLTEENGILKIDDVFGIDFLEKETKRSFTSRASKNYETGKGSGCVWAHENIEYSDEFETPLASKVLDALANIDFLSLIKENNENADCSSVRIDYEGEYKTYWRDENGLRTFPEHDNEEKKFNKPTYVYEDGKLERIYFSDEVDGSFIYISVGADNTNIGIYVPKTYEK